jgi:hypothetical protein
MFDINEFVKVNVPSIILHNRKDYYVKGGIAYDKFFVNKTNSIDWDLVGTEEFDIFVEQQMQIYAKDMGLTVKKRRAEFNDLSMHQYGFEGYEAEKNDPFFLDVLIKSKVKSNDYYTIDNINYMNMPDFVSDLIITMIDRHKKADIYQVYINGSSISEDIDKFNHKNNEKFSLDMTLESLIILTLELYKKYILNKVVISLNKKILNDVYVSKLEKLDRDTSWSEYFKILNESPIDYLEKMGNKLNPNTYDILEKELEIYEEFSESFSEVASSVYSYQKTMNESEMTYKKYNKTVKRMENIIDISWKNLSDEFKIYLLTKCRNTGEDTMLIEVSDTCSSVFNCDKKYPLIVKDTSGCIDSKKLKLKL